MSERAATVWAGASRRLQDAVRAVVLVVLLVVASLTSATFAQGTSAIVEGAQRVNVRRGPGQNFPKVGTITAGERVEVEGMQGEWAHIRTAGGGTGYVRSVFLAPPRERPRGAPPTVPSPRETQPARATDAGERGSVAAGAPAEASPSPRHGSTPKMTPDVQPSATARSGETDAETARRLQAELARATESAPLSGGTLSERTAADSAEPFGAGTLGVAVVALLVGWLAGMAVGRRQERNRRSRIRF